AGTGEHSSRLSGLLDADDGGLYLRSPPDGARVELVGDDAHDPEDRDRDRGGKEAAGLAGFFRSSGPQRFHFAEILTRGFGHWGLPSLQLLLSASTTRSLIAWRAGSHPPSTPITAEKIRACVTIAGVTLNAKARVEKVRKLPKLVENPFIGIASTTPIAPAARARASDSNRKDPSTALGLNPSARRVPISVVRAETAAYIVFIAAKIAPTPMMIATTIPRARS